jgi:tetratricopeptide (TPR) repeat protein
MPTIEQHLAEAQRAFAGRDVPGTLSHLADALAIDPFDTPALGMAYQVLPQIPNLVAMTTPQKNTPPKMVAIHAMALGLAHQWSPAMDLLFKLAANDPKTPYLLWADNWVSTHPSALLLDMGTVGPSIARFADSFEDPLDASSPGFETLEAGTKVLQRLSDTFVDSQALKTVYVKLLRRAKRYDDALRIAAQIKTKDAHFGTLMTAWTYKDMERWPDAIAAFHAAHALKPDPGILLDIGDLHLNQGQFEQACETYRQVPQGEGYDWAYPSFLSAHHLITRDPATDQQLAALAAQGNERARELHALVHAYREHQPSPRDLTAGIVRDIHHQFQEHPGQGTPSAPAVLGVNLTSIESPSVYLAFDLAVRLGKSHAKMNVTPEKEAKPDPRAPLMTAIGRGADLVYQQYPLWVYEGSRPKVNAPPPPAAIVEALARAVSTPFDWAAWQASAAQLAPSFRGQATQLACALVHPPLPSDPRTDPVQWVYRYQLMGALVIAKLDDGWNGAERRGGLLALVHGPIDWLITAALPALALVYEACPEARPELSQIFGALRQRVADIGYTCYRAALEAVTMRLPDVDEAARRQAFARLVKATNKPYLG